MITVIDYKLGNIKSVANALKYLRNGPVRISSVPRDILNADGIVLPGVGAFGKAMANMKDLELVEPVKEYIKSGKPYLGICLGLQLLFTQSTEYVTTPGFDIITGKVKELPQNVKSPHIGWNRVGAGNVAGMFKGIENNSFFYFDHSYHVEVKNSKNLGVGETEYGCKFISALIKDNIWGVQFHPEKSADRGLKLLENFTKKCYLKE